MTERDILVRLLAKGLEMHGISKDRKYIDRLKKELKEIDAQAEHEYYLALHKKFQQENLMFPQNENNTLVDWLLELAPDFDIEKPFSFVQGEHPDIDVDIISELRDWVKKVWAIERYGQDYVCEIGTYGTLGIKMAILDTSKVYGLPKSEIQAITITMEDKVDSDDGTKKIPLEWDKALEVYPDFKAYCDKYPEVAQTAKDMQGRKKSGGVHAGGLIISSKRIDGFVPLEVRSVKKENPNGVVCSAWAEGLHTQDLQPVGLIKYDLLVIENLKQIAYACKLVKERHGLKSINAIPGSWDWSDTSYLEDPAALKMADRADLRCIFQFDGQGIRKLVSRGKVSCFDDLVAYSALYRPGPLNMGMGDRFVLRKTNKEPYSIHPVLLPILGKTHGVMIYQEQVMDILRAVGQIPDMHTEMVRKAISKKKVKQFIKYKEMFMKHGQEVLHVNPDFVDQLWKQIESFAEYGFNKSHACAYTYISSRLLWLKAHYPLEFYTGVLMCEDEADKFKDYRLDARYHNVNISPVHINNSKENFHIEGSDIYFGFQKIKGIGMAVAKRIVENQPYANFQDFLERFGTDTTPIKPLIALGVFDKLEPKYSRLRLRRFHEYYKDKTAKFRASQQRYEASLEKKNEELRELLLTEINGDDPDFELMSQFTDEAEAKWQERFESVEREVKYKYKSETRTRKRTLFELLLALKQTRNSTISTRKNKDKMAEENPLSLSDFNEDSVKFEKEEVEIPLLLDEICVDGVKAYPAAERQYYGFQWIHQLETCPDYEGFTIDKFLQEAEENPSPGCVEVLIVAVRPATTKAGVQYWKIDIEDANGKRMTVHVWKDDYKRFEEDWAVGTMLKMRVHPPGGGFNTLTFESVPKHKRHTLGPKEADYRVCVMKRPEAEKKPVDVNNFVFDENAIEGLE